MNAKNLSARDILVKAKDILQPGAWTQGCYARDERGIGVSEESQNAVCFCALGAMNRARKELETQAASGAYTAFNDASGSYPAFEAAWDTMSRLAVAEVGVGGIAQFNDAPTRTREEVVALFDKAIQEYTA